MKSLQILYKRDKYSEWQSIPVEQNEQYAKECLRQFRLSAKVNFLQAKYKLVKSIIQSI